MFRRSGVVPQLGTLPTLVLGALLIVALFHTLPGIFSGGGRPRAAQLLETSAQPSVAASARRGAHARQRLARWPTHYPAVTPRNA